MGCPQSQQMNVIKQDTEHLWNTLLTKPGQFGKQLADTVHSAVIKPIADGMSTVTADECDQTGHRAPVEYAAHQARSVRETTCGYRALGSNQTHRRWDVHSHSR